MGRATGKEQPGRQKGQTAGGRCESSPASINKRRRLPLSQKQSVPQAVSDTYVCRGKFIMNKLTIGKRLALGFGFVLALGLFVAIAVFYNLMELQSHFSEFEGRMVARERLAYRGQVELGNGIHYFKNTVLRGGGDYPQKFAGSMAAIDRIVSEYQALGPLSGEAQRALDEIIAGSQKYRAVIGQVADMRREWCDGDRGG